MRPCWCRQGERRINGFRDWRFYGSVTEPHERIGKVARSSVGMILDLLLPTQCLACGAAVDRTGALCAECWSRTAFIEPPLCRRCGLPFEVDEDEVVLCGVCLDAPPDSSGAL